MKPMKSSMGKVASAPKTTTPSKPSKSIGVSAVASRPAMPARAIASNNAKTQAASALRATPTPKPAMPGRGLGSGPTMSKPAGLTAQQVKNIRSIPKSVTKPMVTPKPSMPTRAAAPARAVAPKPSMLALAASSAPKAVAKVKKK